MGWGLILSYTLGVPTFAFLIGSWWLGHFIAAGTATDGGEKLNWSGVRIWSFWVSGFPLLVPGVAHVLLWVVNKVLSLFVRKGASESYSFVVTAYLNGTIWGVCIVALIRRLVTL